MRMIFFTVVILFWFCLSAFAACEYRCKPLREYVVTVSGDTHIIVRDGVVYKCWRTRVYRGRKV